MILYLFALVVGVLDLECDADIALGIACLDNDTDLRPTAALHVHIEGKDKLPLCWISTLASVDTFLEISVRIALSIVSE